MSELLHERESELAAIDSLLDSVEAAHGAVLVVFGAAGIGKTALAQVARQRAEARGLIVHSARGSEFEQDFAYGGVRQLFEVWLASVSEEERRAAFAGAAGLAAQVFGFELPTADRPPGDRAFATPHGLYWLAANMAFRGPRLLVIDDAHWLDGPSLRWLRFVAGRIGQLPLGLVLTARPSHGDDEREIVGELRKEESVTIVEPIALTAAAVGQLAQETYGDTIDESFTQACLTVTGGNPFYVRELLRTLAEDAVVPGPPPMRTVSVTAPEAVRRSVFGRLKSLPEGCARLAQLVAVSGETLDLGSLTTLMGVDRATGAELAAALANQAIFTRGPEVAFTHPILRAAVYEEIPARLREREHLQIAQLLARSGGKPEQIAAQLMAIEPASDRWAADQLRTAATGAIREGAPDVAVRYLRRAAREFDAQSWPRGLAFDLGRAEAQVGDPAASQHLLAALTSTTDSRERARIALEAGVALRSADRIGEAVEVLEAAIDAVRGIDPQLEMRLEATLYLTACASLRAASRVWGRPQRFRERLGGGRTSSERAMLSMVALDMLFNGSGDANEVFRTGEQSLEGATLTTDEMRMNAAVMGRLFAWTDRLSLATRHLAAAAASARDAGSPAVFVYALTSRCIAHLRAGNLAEAIADGRNALDTMDAYGLPFRVALTCATTAEALLEFGDIQGAEDIVARYFEHPYNTDDATHAAILHSRALLAIAQGDLETAIEDLRGAGAHFTQWGVDNPTFVAWRSTQALALLTSGRRADALNLAREEVALARRFAAPRPLGIALRVLGLAEGGETGVATLEEACATLSGTEVHLEHARALTELGATLRRANERARARDMLRRGLDLADQCRADPLIARVSGELAAAGGRPRRARITGRDALTPSELRVAELAASGRSNREIAQALFVTLRTVEMHLTHAYRKLGVRGRPELAAGLSRAGTEGAPSSLSPRP